MGTQARTFQGVLKDQPRRHEAGTAEPPQDLSPVWPLIVCWDPEVQGHWPMRPELWCLMLSWRWWGSLQEGPWISLVAMLGCSQEPRRRCLLPGEQLTLGPVVHPGPPLSSSLLRSWCFHSQPSLLICRVDNECATSRDNKGPWVWCRHWVAPAYGNWYTWPHRAGE